MDPEQIDRLFGAYADELYHYLLKLTRNQERAEDLLQEAFLSALKYYKAGIENERAWLYKIAYHAFAAEYKKGKRMDLTAMPETELAAKDETEDREWALLRENIVESLQKEKEAYAHIFVLRSETDLSQDEIAATLEIPRRTLGRYWENIRKFLMKNYKSELEAIFRGLN